MVKSKKMMSFVRFGIGAVLVVVAQSSMAASTWNMDACSLTALSSTVSGSGCVVGTNVGGNSVHAAAYSVSNASATAQFSTADLLQHGVDYGLGVRSGSETAGAVPDHTMDNSDRTELIVFKFDTAVILDKITLGWTSSDADFTLMAYTGPGAPTVTGKMVGNLASGWALVQNSGDAAPDVAYADSGTNIVRTVNSGSVSSSWWVISAYNAGYGAGALDSLNDFVKIMTISSKDATPPGKVPEPGSIALMGAALVGFVATRRRKQNSA